MPSNHAATAKQADSNLPPKYDPAELVRNVGGFLGSQGIDVAMDSINSTNAYLSAATLLISMGVDPIVDPADESAAADTVRGALLEAQTRTQTRSRRAL